MLRSKIIDTKIASVHMDGDSQNMRGINLFRLGKDLTDQMSCLSIDYCDFPNPADPSRRLALVLCATHDGKGDRNQLRASGNQAEYSINSKESYAKYLLNKGVNFTWITIERCFDRCSKKGVQDTPITKEITYLDRWNKMPAF